MAPGGGTLVGGGIIPGIPIPGGRFNDGSCGPIPGGRFKGGSCGGCGGGAKIVGGAKLKGGRGGGMTGGRMEQLGTVAEDGP